MCNLLKRRGKAYAIAAGHTSNSNVIKKTADFIRAAVAAQSLAGSKVGVFGSSFDGMGDFLISKEEAKETFGIDIVKFDDKQMKAFLDSVTDA
jgi:L-fucose isomerase-like protein